MPLLTKKTFGIKKSVISKSQPVGSSIKSSDATKKFKTPLLAKENIEQILRDSPSSSQSNNYSQYKKNNVTKSTKLKKIKSNVSIKSVHLSFESISQKDSETTSDLSFRMNEPQIKEAYLHFVKRLSQSSNKDNTNVTSSPLSEKLKDDSTLLSEKSSQESDKLYFNKVNEKNTDKINLPKRKNETKKAQTIKRQIFNRQSSKDTILSTESQIESQKSCETQKAALSSDSGLSLSQEVLNSEKVKAAYLEFVQNLKDNDEDIPNVRKDAQKQTQKRHLESCFSEESLDQPILKIKTKKVRRIISDKDEDMKQSQLRTKTTNKGLIRKTNRDSDSRQKNNASKQKNNAKKEKKGKKKCTLIKNKTPSEENNFSHLTLEEKMAMIHESRNVGLYALCDICDKARYLPHVKDPLDLPDKWYCAMNSDESHNKCSDPEEVDEDEDYLVHNLYNSGSIVWAKMDGYPWWPAMVEDDPDTEDYFWLEGNSMTPAWYHVTFFDSQEVTRAWMRPLSLKPFKININNPMFHTPEKNKYKYRVCAAFKQASDAIELPLFERLKKYSFINRYKKHLKKKPMKATLEDKTKRKEKLSQDLFSDYDMESLQDNPSFVPINTYDNGTSKSNPVPDDFTVELNNFNWIESQNLSFDLLE